MNMGTESTQCAADWDKKDDFTLPTLALILSFSPLIFLLCPLLTSLLHQHFSRLILCSFLFLPFFSVWVFFHTGDSHGHWLYSYIPVSHSVTLCHAV